MASWLDEIKWNKDGLIPVIVQESNSLKILMHAWMNREALVKTHEDGVAVYWSRSRQSLWTKGETSGHIQKVESISLDCDADTILLTVKQEGGIACHTGRHSCFYRRLVDEKWDITEAIIKDPKEIYQ